MDIRVNARAERGDGGLHRHRMVVLELNVLSELMRPAADRVITAWFADRATPSLYLTAVSEAELRFGIAIMPAGRRRDGLAEGLERMLRTGFANRILPFDSRAAHAYAEIAAARRRIGRRIPEADCQIAAIARSHGMAVATRNVGDFSDTGIEVIDPWAGA